MRQKLRRINARVTEKQLLMMKEIIAARWYYGISTLTDVMMKGIKELYDAKQPTPIEAANGRQQAREAKEAAAETDLPEKINAAQRKSAQKANSRLRKLFSSKVVKSRKDRKSKKAGGK